MRGLNIKLWLEKPTRSVQLKFFKILLLLLKRQFSSQFVSSQKPKLLTVMTHYDVFMMSFAYLITLNYLVNDRLLPYQILLQYHKLFYSYRPRGVLSPTLLLTSPGVAPSKSAGRISLRKQTPFLPLGIRPLDERKRASAIWTEYSCPNNR